MGSSPIWSTRRREFEHTETDPPLLREGGGRCAQILKIEAEKAQKKPGGYKLPAGLFSCALRARAGLSGAFIRYSLPVPSSISTSTVLSVAGASPASCCTVVAAIVVATLAAVAAAVVAAVVAASPLSGRLRSRHTCSILVSIHASKSP